jgi:hypothetical protein
MERPLDQLDDTELPRSIDGCEELELALGGSHLGHVEGKKPIG